MAVTPLIEGRRLRHVPLLPKMVRAAQPLPEARRTIERPAVHLHLHGVSAEDVAAILALEDFPQQ